MTTPESAEAPASKRGSYSYMELMSEWQLNNRDFSWMDYAACVGADQSIFFADTGGWHARHEKAREYCGKCIVYKNCMKFAIDNQIEYGIWGGLSPSQRKANGGKHVGE